MRNIAIENSVLNALGRVLGFLKHLTLRKWQREKDEVICLDESLPGFVGGTALLKLRDWATLPLLPLPTTLVDTEH